MSQQSDMADAVYHQLSAGPVSVAHLVREIRTRWGPDHGVGSVHHFVSEVATDLLHTGNVEVGDVRAGTFEPCLPDPWDSYDKMDDELMAMDAFFDDESRYVFRKKPVV